MSERRNTERRRSANTPEEKISRLSERRQGDRRDSPRYPMTFLVRDAGEDHHWEEREGDLSIGGIYWRGKTPPKRHTVDVRFRLPGVPKEIRAQGEIIRLQDVDRGINFHVRFTELEVKDELAIAKYLDDLIADAAGGARR